MTERPNPTPTELLRRIKTHRVTGVLAEAGTYTAANKTVLGWLSPWLKSVSQRAIPHELRPAEHSPESELS